MDSNQGIGWNKLSKTKKIFVVIVFVTFVIVVFRSLKDGTLEPSSTQTSEPTQAQKETAKKELAEFLQLTMDAGLVQSYEFSEKANVVYVNKVWYTQNVQFKKDFLAKVSNLKEAVTGYHRFQVRDALSDEKVAEVTAFSGSLEVYK